MKYALAIAAVLGAMSGRAHGDVWRDALDNADPNHSRYEFQLEAGDNSAVLSTAESAAMDTQLRNVKTALTAYRTAAELEPSAAEPYYRIGRLLYAAYFGNCSTMTASGFAAQASKLCIDAVPELLQTDPTAHHIAEDTIAAWDEFEKRAPLDPRITSSFLFERAILNTKLASHDHYAAAAKDYEAILDRTDFVEHDSVVTGNLAETYMMLDRLDDAIEMYRRSIRDGSNDAIFGLAVALDRDDEGLQAKDYILEVGLDGFKEFSGKIMRGEWFFVPAGEKFYYLALIEEAFGDTDTALADWQHFIASGAHPQFQPRARAHVTALEKLPPPKHHVLEELDPE